MANHTKGDLMDIPRGKLVGYNGPGSIYVNTDGISYMISAVDNWYNSKEKVNEDLFKVHDKRLEKLLHVSHFKEVPAYRNPYNVENKINSGIRIPVTRFPLLHYCNSCGLLSNFKEADYRKTKYCQNCNKKRDFVQFPIVIVCSNGHINDFPYLKYLHPNSNNINKEEHKVKIDRSNSSSILNWRLRCSCGKSHGLSGITGHSTDDQGPTPFQKEMKNNNFNCSGKRPWSGENFKENCDSKPSAVLKNSLSIYQPETIPVLSLTGDNNLSNYISYDDILLDEFRKLSLSEFEKDTGKLKVENSFNNSNTSIIRSVNFVRRLQEIIVQTGFTRLTSVDENESVNKVSLEKKNSILFSNSSYHDWFPAKRQYGEGIFVEFNESLLTEWSKTEKVNSRFTTMTNRVDSYYENEKFNSAPSILIHTISHALIKELSSLSGYTMTAIKEKLYFTDNKFGLLIYVTDSDKDGTFGGLVRLAEESDFKKIFNKALKNLDWCSSDPVCFEIGTNTGQGLGNTNGSACHNCSFVPSTSCPHRNCYLDRDFVGRIDAPECITYNNKYSWFGDEITINIEAKGELFFYDSWEEAKPFEKSNYYINNNWPTPDYMGGTISIDGKLFNMKYLFQHSNTIVLLKNQDINEDMLENINNWTIMIEE